MKLLTIAGLAIAVLASFVSATSGKVAVKPPTHLTGSLGAPFSKPRPTAPSVPPKPLPCHEGKSSCLDFWQSFVCKDGHYAVERCPSKTSCNKKSGKCEAGPVDVRHVVPKMIPGPCEEGESFCTGGLSIVHCIKGLWHHETCPTPGVCHDKKCTDSPHDSLASRSEPEDASVPPKLLSPTGKCTPHSKPRCNAARELVTCDRFGREQTQRCGRGFTCDEGICTFSSFLPTAGAAAYECPGHEGEGACIMSDTLIKCQQGQWQVIKCSAGTHCVNNICGTGDAASQGATPRSRYRDWDLTYEVKAPPELALPRHTLQRLIAIRTGHGDFAWYHRKFRHKEAKLECGCGMEKTPDHIVHCRYTTRLFVQWPNRPFWPPTDRKEGLAYLKQLMRDPQRFADFLQITKFYTDN